MAFGLGNLPDLVGKGQRLDKIRESVGLDQLRDAVLFLQGPVRVTLKEGLGCFRGSQGRIGAAGFAMLFGIIGHGRISSDTFDNAEIAITVTKGGNRLLIGVTFIGGDGGIGTVKFRDNRPFGKTVFKNPDRRTSQDEAAASAFNGSLGQWRVNGHPVRIRRGAVGYDKISFAHDGLLLQVWVIQYTHLPAVVESTP